MSKKIFWTIVLVVLVKALYFFTHHIADEAFIHWRVAENFKNFGVIGFNGKQPISATDSYLYTFCSYLFSIIFSQKYFIIPLLLFNSLLFAIGTNWFLQIFYNKFTETNKIIFGIIILNFLPPAINISILGLEYGLLFFLYIAFLFFGLIKRQKWAFFVLPILIIWTRLDASIFLAVCLLFDLLHRRKLNYIFLLSIGLAILSIAEFNYTLFGNWINNTYIAKNIAYPYELRADIMGKLLTHKFGIIPIPERFLSINWFTILLLLVEVFVFVYYLFQSINENKYIVSLIFVFAWVKQFIFINRLSIYDWHYWIPQIFLFSIIIIALLEGSNYAKSMRNLLFLLVLPMVLFHTAFIISYGYANKNFDEMIGNYLNEYETNKSRIILLKNAGYVPYYSGLKTIDFEGKVDYRIQKELQKDPTYFIQPTLQTLQPEYYLSSDSIQTFKNAKDKEYFNQNYMLIKEFKYENYIQSKSRILTKIYHLNHSTPNYYLYRRYDSFK